MALRNGYKAGVGIDNGWKVLYVEIPEGQFSWHFSPDDYELLEGLPEFNGEWDGTYNGRDVNLVRSIIVKE